MRCEERLAWNSLGVYRPECSCCFPQGNTRGSAKALGYFKRIIRRKVRRYERESARSEIDEYLLDEDVA